MNFKKYHVSRNLFDMATVENGKGIAMDGSVIDYEKRCSTVTPIDVSTYSNVTLSFTATFSGTKAIYALFNVNTLVTRQSAVNSGAMIDVSGGNKLYICFYDATETVQKSDLSNVMLNDGSTPLPYEPYSSEVWHDIPHYIMGTSTDTLTTPADIYANDTTATVGLKGQMEQSSQPSPSSPVMPQECGERTGNLFDSDILLEAVEWEKHDNIYSGYSSALHSKFNSFDKCIPVDAAVVNIKVMFKYENLNTALFVVFWYTDGTSTQNSKNGKSGEWTVLSGQSDSNKTLKGIAFSYGTNDLVELKEIMLNSGSQSLPYEPYGYKIPILSNSQTTNVYLGEVESTRRIKKLVFDGTENWTIRSGQPSNIFFIEFYSTNFIRNKALCTHYINQDSGFFDILEDKHCLVTLSSDGVRLFIGIRDSNFADRFSFRNHIATQYAAGTPVTVWYVLAEPTTGIVNEPIRKIGDYADTVSGITIPTTAGTNAIDVLTTLKPSEVSVNYHGWHPVSAVHERESGAWT